MTPRRRGLADPPLAFAQSATHRATHEKCETGTDEDAHRVRSRRAPAALRKIVRDHGKKLPERASLLPHRHPYALGTTEPKLLAPAHKAVITLQNSTPIVMSVVRRRVSAIFPIGIPRLP